MLSRAPRRPPAASPGTQRAAGRCCPASRSRSKLATRSKARHRPTSTADSAFSLTPGQYTLSAELTGFGRVEQPVVVSDSNCTQTVDLTLSLAPRQAARGTQSGPLSATSRTTTQQATAAGGGRGATPNAAAGAGRGGQATRGGFQTLEVRQSADAAATADTQLSASETEQAARALLPPGFSTESSGRRDRDHRQRRLAWIAACCRIASARSAAANSIRPIPRAGSAGASAGRAPTAKGKARRRTRRSRRIRRTGGRGGPGGPGGCGGPGGRGRPRRRRRRLLPRRPRRGAEALSAARPTTRSAARSSTARPFQLRAGPDAAKNRSRATPTAARSAAR